jgi:hypothetical protein
MCWQGFWVGIVVVAGFFDRHSIMAAFFAVISILTGLHRWWVVYRVCVRMNRAIYLIYREYKFVIKK